MDPTSRQVSRGLTLFLRLQEPTKMRELLERVRARQPAINAALRDLHYVHFARFVPYLSAATGEAVLMVVTEYDGDLRPYVLDFVAVIGDVFNEILAYVQKHPPLPVQEYPEEFCRFVQDNSGPSEVWSAYEDKTVLDIIGLERATAAPRPAEPPARELPLHDLQGNIVVGYRAHHAAHLALHMDTAEGARRFLQALLEADGHTVPRISTAEWQEGTPPPHSLNLGFTHGALEALGVSPLTLRHFPDAFRLGPAEAERAKANGDTGSARPETWAFGGPGGKPVHLLLSLYAKEHATLQRHLCALRDLAAGCGLRESHLKHARAMKDGKVHFGYRDGIAQPRIAGAPNAGAFPDLQPTVSPGDFLLGGDYLNRYGGRYIGRLPPALATNGTYAVVRMCRQEVDAFDRLLSESGHGELLAAKLMGRWRNGRPLSLYPDKDGGPLAPADLPQVNEFDFRPTGASPESFDDTSGSRCPMGAHIRRMNPRSSVVAGKPHSRRIIRRGMPYGPEDGDPECGLYGVFICGDIEAQFEFLVQQWANKDLASPGLRGMQDPFVGPQDQGGRFTYTLPGSTKVQSVTLPRLVTTRGSVYLFMPGIAGLEYLATPEPTTQGDA